MTKQATLITTSIVITVSIIYFLFFSQSAMEDAQDLIRKELPPGSTKQQVYDFLEARDIQSGAYEAGPDPYAGLPDKDRQWKRYVVAWISKKSYVPFLPDYTIKIYFYFDENQNLEEFKLQKLDDVP
jgi:hypothetical protein